MKSSNSSERGRRADTTEIVGHQEPPAINPQWKSYYRTLLELQEAVESQKHTLEKDAASLNAGVQSEQADVATDSYDRDLALALLSSEQNAALEINEALERIRSGTYGKCELTGKTIPLKRLKAVPWTRFTAAAERELEQRGDLPQYKARLGERGAIPREGPANPPPEG